MKQRICRAGLPAVSAISTCGNTGEGKLLRPLRGLPRQHLQVQLVLLAGRQTPPTPRRTARIPRPCGPTSSIDDLALPISRTDLAGWVFPTRVLLTKSDAKQRAAAATRVAPRSGGQQLGVDAGQCLGTGGLLLVYSPIVVIEMATAWPMSATVASVSQVFAASRVTPAGRRPGCPVRLVNGRRRSGGGWGGGHVLMMQFTR